MGSSEKSYMTNGLLIYVCLNICALSHILESAALHMTLHPIPSEFSLYTEENFLFFFISVPYLRLMCYQIFYNYMGVVSTFIGD